MLLKSSEINDYSWIINALLESPFCSRSCCQTCFPSIVRPMNGLCEWILKNFLICSRNEPLHLFLVVLSVSDEEDELLSSKLRTQRENVSLVQYRSNSFSQWERFSVKSQQVLFFVVLLLPLIDTQNLSHPVVTHILRADLLAFLCHCSNPSRTYLNHENSDPRVSIVSAQKHNSDLNSMFTVQITGCNFQHGSNFGVPLDPSFRLWCWIFSRKSVFTTSHCMKLCQVSSVFGTEILSIVQNTQKSCIDTTFTQSVLLW